jgi:hypothetical protein
VRTSLCSSRTSRAAPAEFLNLLSNSAYFFWFSAEDHNAEKVLRQSVGYSTEPEVSKSTWNFDELDRVADQLTVPFLQELRPQLIRNMTLSTMASLKWDFNNGLLEWHYNTLPTIRLS